MESCIHEHILEVCKDVYTLLVYGIARVFWNSTDAKLCLPAGDSDSVRGLPMKLLLQLLGKLLLPGARA